MKSQDSAKCPESFGVNVCDIQIHAHRMLINNFLNLCSVLLTCSSVKLSSLNLYPWWCSLLIRYVTSSAAAWAAIFVQTGRLKANSPWYSTARIKSSLMTM